MIVLDIETHDDGASRSRRCASSPLVAIRRGDVASMVGMTPDHIELAWAAGLFDGEGCTYLQRGKRQRDRPGVCLTITQCFDPEVLARFRDAVDVGHVSGPVNESGTGGGPRWNYRSQNTAKSLQALTALWPYLSRPKRDQALRVVEAFRLAVPEAYRTAERRDEFERLIERFIQATQPQRSE